MAVNPTGNAGTTPMRPPRPAFAGTRTNENQT
jgi:hypothetical protein